MGSNKEKESDFAFKKLPIDSERAVSDKELLTFTNLTNLKWEFLDYGNKKGDLPSEASLRLSEVLKDPERFAIRDAEGKIQDYVYIKNAKKEEDIDQEKKEEGIRELRQEAGIAMEYLEKDEGEFLNNPIAYDLEVIDCNNYLTLNGAFV
ncbi:hypothetical protein GM661_04650 [Iocasia frigidifontis]|uniref:Uncharacterized protein n=1 Tax=Iocasia fonsfrigidae TaxID=2682810 RepID=A0A8A7K6B5_9FIRM|nr:hypothetical protein [Iocasia fonsfrigidae]QTL97323.1 hypothetical protein GM661_04650 [Iocasia fonsfrigidae]